jgi:hypothetical protein
MCEKCIASKAAAIQLLAAHAPALATTVAARTILDDCFKVVQEVFDMTAEEAKEKGPAVAEGHWNRLREMKSRDLDEVRVLMNSISTACKAVAEQVKNVLEAKVINDGETEGLDPELVEDIKRSVRRRHISDALKELFADGNLPFGALGVDLTEPDNPSPFTKAPPVTT